MSKQTQARNGYEIRANLIELAQSLLVTDYHNKLSLYRDKLAQDQSYSGEVPETPSADKIVEVAAQFNDFVSGDNKKE